MGKPIKLPRWSDQVPANNIEPSEEKKNTGWVPAEKPPAQFMNWLQNKFCEWSKYLLARVDMQQHSIVRSNSTVIWDGAQLTFASDIQLIFREGDDVITNTIPLANSPVALADGDVLVLKKDNTSTPVPLVLQAVYANLDVGEFAIVAEGTLDDNDPESELVLFRRRGSDLEMPVFGKIYQGGDTLNFGQIETHNHQNNAEGGTIDHGSALTGLGDDDHSQYVHNTIARIISAVHTFNPGAAGAPFVLGANAQGQLVGSFNADLLDGQHGSFYQNAGNLNAGTIPDARIGVTGVTQHQGSIDHGSIAGLGDDDHPHYSLASGARAFTGVVGGVSPVAANHLATKGYVDGQVVSDHGALGGLGDDDHTQYLHLNKGGQTLQQNLAVAGGVTVDGINISIHTHSISLGRTFIVTGKQTQNIETDEIFTIGGFTSSDMPVWGICQIDMTQGGGGFDSDNKAWIGGPGQQTFDANVSPTVPSYNGGTGNWEFRIRQRAGNESIVCGYNRSVIECTDSTGGPS